MSEKIDLEFSADDRDLTQKISQLNKSLKDLGNAGDMSKGLSDNLNSIRQNIELMKQILLQPFCAIDITQSVTATLICSLVVILASVFQKQLQIAKSILESFLQRR